MFSHCEGQKYHDALCLVIVKDRNTMTHYIYALYLVIVKDRNTMTHYV